MLKYPEHESIYALFEATSWVDGEGCCVDIVEDRFQSLYILREVETGIESVYGKPLSATGLGLLSLKDVQTLGFSTSEYRAAILFEAYRERFIRNESELLEALENPYATDDDLSGLLPSDTSFR